MFWDASPGPDGLPPSPCRALQGGDIACDCRACAPKTSHRFRSLESPRGFSPVKVSSCLSYGLALQRVVDKALKNQAAISASEELFTGAFGMRHQAGDVAAFVADPGDIPKRSIGICSVCHFALGVAVLPKELVVRFERLQRLVVGEVAAFTVCNGQLEQLVRWNLVRERRVGGEG